MGRKVSARIKSKVKNKFIRAIRRVEATELQKEQFFRNRKNKQAQSA